MTDIAVTAPPVNPATQFTLHFMKSIQEVLTMMTKTTVTIGKPLRKTDPSTSYDVSGIIGFSGDFVGSMILSFQMSAATGIVKAFTGEDLDAASPDFADAIGELANMIGGSAKKAFGGTNISIPSVIIGAGHTVGRQRDVPCVVIPCTCAQGDFAVEVNIKSAAT